MLRRNPTRIELKLDDLHEYNEMKKEKEIEQNKQRLMEEKCQTPSSDFATPVNKTGMVHERIGYDPKPLPQPSRLQIH